MVRKIDLDVLAMVHQLGSRISGFVRKARTGKRVSFEYDGETWEVNLENKNNGSEKHERRNKKRSL